MQPFVKHVYDIDIVNIYHLLENKLSIDTSEKGEAKKKDFLDRLDFSVIQILSSNKEDYDINFKNYKSLPPYVITPNNDFDNYIYWLGLFLLSNPSYKTNFILEYHYNRWSNKMKFLNCIEFYIIDSVTNNDFIKDEMVLKTITKWVYSKRLVIGYFSSETNKTNNSNQSTKTKEKKNPDIIEINQIEYVQKVNKSPEMGDESVSSTEKNISASIVFADKVGEVLLSVLSVRLFDKSDYKNLEELLLNGKSNGLIGLSITKLDLIGLFKDLINTEAFIYIRNKRKVAKWICSNFKTDNIPNNVKGEFNLQTTINRLSDKTYFYNKDFVSDVIDKINKSRAGTKD